MKRMLMVLAVLVILGGMTAAQRPGDKVPVIEPAEVVSTVDPGYPPNSIAQGTVILQVKLDKWGEIESVKVVKGIPSLTEEAQKAVKKWKFKGATLDKQPVASTVTVAMMFRTIVSTP